MKSSWKDPEFNLKFIFWTVPLNPERRKFTYKIMRKQILIYESTAMRALEIYNGKKWFTKFFDEEITGQNIGQFIRTKVFLKHNANKLKKERAKKAKEIKKKLPKVQTKEQQLLIEAIRRKRKKRK